VGGTQANFDAVGAVPKKKKLTTMGDEQGQERKKRDRAAGLRNLLPLEKKKYLAYSTR